MNPSAFSKDETSRLNTMIEWSKRVGVSVGTRPACIEALYAEYERLKTSVPDWVEPAYEVEEYACMINLWLTWQFGNKELTVSILMTPLATGQVIATLMVDRQIVRSELLADSFPTYWKWLWEVGEG